jgi:hypothetical protein
MPRDRPRDPLIPNAAPVPSRRSDPQRARNPSPRAIAFVPARAPEPASALATFRVLAKDDLDADAALASAVGCLPPPRPLLLCRLPALWSSRAPTPAAGASGLGVAKLPCGRSPLLLERHADLR